MVVSLNARLESNKEEGERRTAPALPEIHLGPTQSGLVNKSFILGPPEQIKRPSTSKCKSGHVTYPPVQWGKPRSNFVNLRECQRHFGMFYDESNYTETGLGYLRVVGKERREERGRRRRVIPPPATQHRRGVLMKPGRGHPRHLTSSQAGQIRQLQGARHARGYRARSGPPAEMQRRVGQHLVEGWGVGV